jgi:hypothetical protein
MGDLSIARGPWQPEIRWDTPAGVALDTLLARLPADWDRTIVLFGSSPLQLALEPGFTSADVDLFCDEAHEEIEAALAAAHLRKEDGEFYIQCCWEGNFRTSPRWRHRAAAVPRGNATLLLPHPIDILIAKLHRYEEKDRNAFRLVIERTGHPTEQEFLTELQFSIDLFRPGFDEEMTGDITTNTAAMWPEIFGREIDVRREIIAPALARLRAGYADDLARRDYKADLRRLGGQD